VLELLLLLLQGCRTLLLMPEQHWQLPKLPKLSKLPKLPKLLLLLQGRW
jgi:hypothetical protein